MTLAVAEALNPNKPKPNLLLQYLMDSIEIRYRN